jgi:hypothetical protein
VQQGPGCLRSRPGTGDESASTRAGPCSHRPGPGPAVIDPGRALQSQYGGLGSASEKRGPCWPARGLNLTGSTNRPAGPSEHGTEYNAPFEVLSQLA